MKNIFLFQTTQILDEKLRKLLSDQSKDIRHRRRLINIHIAMIGWATEFSGFLFIILGSFILGHGNATATLILQTFTVFMIFNVLPWVYLINDDDLKANIAESRHYFNFLKNFNLEKNNVATVEHEESDSSKQDGDQNEEEQHQSPNHSQS